jgi:hypothetical protein
LGHQPPPTFAAGMERLVPIRDVGEANSSPASGCRSRRPSHTGDGCSPLGRQGITGTSGAVAIPTGIPTGIPYLHAVSARKRENHPSFQRFNESSKGRYQPRLRPQGGCLLTPFGLKPVHCSFSSSRFTYYHDRSRTSSDQHCLEGRGAGTISSYKEDGLVGRWEEDIAKIGGAVRPPGLAIPTGARKRLSVR